MMVCNEKLNNRTNCLVNLRAVSVDFHPFLCGCPASCNELTAVNDDDTQPAGTSWLKNGMIAKMRNIDIILQGYFQDGFAFVSSNLATINNKTNLIHQQLLL
jgi:hypothetical protein